MDLQTKLFLNNILGLIVAINQTTLLSDSRLRIIGRIIELIMVVIGFFLFIKPYSGYIFFILSYTFWRALLELGKNITNI